MGLPAAYGGSGDTQSQVAVSGIAVNLDLSDLSTGTSEQTFAGKAISGGSLGTVGIVELTAFLLLSSASGPPTITFRAYYGTTAIVLASAVQIAANLSSAKVRVRVRLQLTTASAQFIDGEVAGHIATAITVNPEDGYIGWGAASEDSTAAKNLYMTLQFGSTVIDTNMSIVGSQFIRLG